MADAFDYMDGRGSALYPPRDLQSAQRKVRLQDLLQVSDHLPGAQRLLQKAVHCYQLYHSIFDTTLSHTFHLRSDRDQNLQKSKKSFQMSKYHGIMTLECL